MMSIIGNRSFHLTIIVISDVIFVSPSNHNHQLHSLDQL